MALFNERMRLMTHKVKLTSSLEKLDFTLHDKGLSIEDRERQNKRYFARYEKEMWKCKSHGKLTLFFCKLHKFECKDKVSAIRASSALSSRSSLSALSSISVTHLLYIAGHGALLWHGRAATQECATAERR